MGTSQFLPRHSFYLGNQLQVALKVLALKARRIPPPVIGR
jgi:hypothetical protein